MSWDDGITGPHRAIAASEHRRIGVLAGPGTGKTSYGLMRRVVRLLEQGVPGKRILLLSFTRVAAADLRDKVASQDAPGVEEVRATTLHGYCFGLLQREAVLAVTDRQPRILLDHEADLMLRDIGDGYGNIHAKRRRLEAFTAGWARRLEDHPGVAGTPTDRDFGDAVMLWLREHRAMLIGEVVPLAYRYLAANPAAAELQAFDHVIVDEYQDLNVLEQSLLDTLAQNCNLCIAGDEDQSIYSVRYANPDGILTYLARDEVENHTITVCGRCPANILDMANCLIRQAPGRQKDDLKPRKTPEDGDEDGAVAIVQWPDVGAEIDGIVSAIARDIGAQRREPGQILVLTNWRKVGEGIRTRLDELEIPARSFFTEEELATDEGREALALLRLTVDVDDAPALRVILGLGDASARTGAYQKLLAYCRANHTTPRAVLHRMAAGERLGLAVSALVRRYRHAMGRVQHLRTLEPEDLVSELFPHDRPQTADLRQVALDALAEATSVEELLQAIVSAITQDEVPQHPDFVRVMSLHKSKGLTSDVVFVAGAVDGVLPTIRDDRPAERAAAMSEGRRLFYVAVTRAASELVISSAIVMDSADANRRGIQYDRRTMRRSGERFVVSAQASPYIMELGPSAPRAMRGQDWLSAR
jgi:DNA helicase-2/ATP-dependent DNA helicase PcrA